MAFQKLHETGSTNIAVAGKWGPGIEDVFPIENGDIPASYVSLPEGIENAGLSFV